MKKLLSVKYSATAFNISFLVLRLILGLTMCVNNGYDKLVHFADKKDSFVNFLGMGSAITLALVVFAEFFCSIFITLGLFTRFTVIPLIITMGYAFFVSHHGNLFGDGEHAALYLSGYIAILLCGPGRVSVDGMINK
ncbi:MAG: DoxX family protein [Chitinophagaceae bacterium]|jgi:putative oxidoreductase|nr:DoxX family protein [Chitinophagaceae bacterium]